MKISYLVTCHNETKTLDNLLHILDNYIGGTDDEVRIVVDNPTKETSDILYNWTSGQTKMFATEHALNKNYAEHKNFGNSLCSGDWIFQLDGDEMPPESLLGENLKSIIGSNPDVELIWVPRINDQRGVTEEDAKEFGWGLVYLPEYESGKVPLVSWPDYQPRIYKNVPDRIKWAKPLHEQIVGHTQYGSLPAELGCALFHDKTIETARVTNRKYKQDFS
jgi:glycosyltransferase involved in cell wall biosynthesis